MFKAIGNFLHRTPWWAMALLGLSTLVLLVVFAAPLHVLRLQQSGGSPEEKRAIKREIDRAFGDSALGVAENIVNVMKSRSTDPNRREELEQALKEIAQARKDNFDAQRDAVNAAKEAIADAQNSAIESAREAAERALEAAVDARETIEETRREAEEKLRASGAESGAALKAFDEMIKAAKVKEQAARDAMKQLEKQAKNTRRNLSVDLGISDADGVKVNIKPESGGHPGISASIDEKGVNKRLHIPLPPVAPPAPKANDAGIAPPPPGKSGKAPTPTTLTTPTTRTAPATPTTPTSPTAPSEEGLNIDGTIGGVPIKGKVGLVKDRGNGHVAISLPPLPPLPQELREDIRSKVAGDVYRVGIGSAMVLAFIPIFIMLLIAKFLVDRSRRALAFGEQQKKAAEVSNVNRQITEARLQALQAQVEPHFLYNTLANVQALTEVDPAAANQMTGHLIQYLRSALPKMRENTSTIGQEIELVRAYLNILKMRMGDRLAFDIDCPADMNSIAFPPLMLPSLVENAIKHGLEPQREGGRIDVLVTPIMTALGQRVRIAVKDTGRGLTDTPTQSGGGVGLSNIRERLIAIYGEAGKLTLESNEPKGVVASIEVPAETGSIPTGNNTAAYAAHAPQASTVKIEPKGWWGRTRYAVAATHGVWAKVMSKTFIALMIVLAVVFGLLLAGLYAGVLPVQVGNARLNSIEGMALGTLALVAGFGVVALALVIVVAVLYGLGVLFAGLLVIIPLVVLISIFPALSPFLLIGVVIYWFMRRNKKKVDEKKDDELPSLNT